VDALQIAIGRILDHQLRRERMLDQAGFDIQQCPAPFLIG
jgi:hypothetical protein